MQSNSAARAAAFHGSDTARTASHIDRGAAERLFRVALSSFVQQQVHVHFDGEDEAIAELRAAGFREARLHPAERIHVIEAAAS